MRRRRRAARRGRSMRVPKGCFAVWEWGGVGVSCYPLRGDRKGGRNPVSPKGRNRVSLFHALVFFRRRRNGTAISIGARNAPAQSEPLRGVAGGAEVMAGAGVAAGGCVAFTLAISVAFGSGVYVGGTVRGGGGGGADWVGARAA